MFNHLLFMHLRTVLPTSVATISTTASRMKLRYISVMTNPAHYSYSKKKIKIKF